VFEVRTGDRVRMNEPDGRLRAGTWNLAGRWSGDHATLITEQRCDVWLLTEVRDDVDLVGYHRHFSEGLIVGRRHWAAVFSRNALRELPDPHVASAAAEVDGITYCSSILPWQSCRSKHPWVGSRHVDKTGAALADIVRALPRSGLVWGGDWNHALSGREYTGSAGGRVHVLAAIDTLGLQVPTGTLHRRNEGRLSVDIIAVPTDREVLGTHRVEVKRDGRYLSDHEAYVVEIG
jgi:hypothetical protein